MKTIFRLLSHLIIFSFFMHGTHAIGGNLIQETDLEYKGSFRVPKGNLGGASTRFDTLANGGKGLEFNNINKSLYIFGHSSENVVTEISIPEIINSTNLSSLKTASVIQPPANITEGKWNNLRIDGSVIGNGGIIGDLLLHEGKLIGTVHAFYDGAYEGALSHYTASPNWSTDGSQFKGMFRVGVPPESTVNGGFVGGYMAHVPLKWQAVFGYPALTGMGGLAIIGRTSLGPCAWGFDPNKIGVIDPSPAEMLVGYPLSNPTLGSYGGTSLYYNMVTTVSGLVFPDNSDTLLFFGRHGLGFSGNGDGCYGYGTTNIEEHGRTATSSPNTCDGTPVTGTNLCCYDPIKKDKGTHAYPYYPYIWAYDANELVKVKKGDINIETGLPYQPWDIKPYSVWALTLPFANGSGDIPGVAYDPTSQLIYISQYGGDKVGYEFYPVIHVYKVNATPSPIIKQIGIVK